MCGLVLSLAVTVLMTAVAAAGDELKQSDPVTIQGYRGVVRTLQTLPYVDSSYATRMIWQRHDDPRLAVLRQEHRLNNVLLKGKTEFERQLQLMDYVHYLWQYSDPKDLKLTFSPEKLSELLRQERRFYCEQYACMLSGLASSVGWVCRVVSHNGHTWAEMWSNQYGKWVYMDPNANRWVPGDDGVPLSVAEVRRKIFTSPNGFPACYGTSPARKTWAGDKRFVVIGYHPNTNLLDQPFDYDKMYVIVDEFSGERKNVRGKGDPVKDPLVDPNFPINQASLRLEAAESGLAVRIRTMTPNFKAFRCRVDGGPWHQCGEAFTWKLHGGANVLEVKSVNQFEVDGPVSKVEVLMDAAMPAAASHDELGPVAPEEEGKVAGMPALQPVAPAGELTPEPFEDQLKEEWLTMWHTAGQWVEWDVNVPADGEYTVAIYYATSHYPKRQLQVNGQAAPGLESFVLPSTGYWSSWKKGVLPAKVTLHKGVNTLRLTCLDNTYAWVRQIAVAGQGTEIKLAAFDFARQGGGQVQKTFVPRNGSIYLWDNKGHWLEWRAEAPAAGRYQVFVRIAGLNEAVRSMTVNGQPVDPPNQGKLGPTGGWQTWTEAPFGEAQLQKGANTVRMENVNGFSLNLNAIRFVDAKGHEILINAVDRTAEGGGKVGTRK